MARIRKSPRSTGSRQTLKYQKPDSQQKPCLVEKLDQCSINCYQNRPYKTEPLLYHSNDSTLVIKSTSNTSEATFLLGIGNDNPKNLQCHIHYPGPKFEHKRHLNQIKKRATEGQVDLPQEEVEAIDTAYNTFDIEPPQTMPEPRRSGRKSKFTDPLLVCPKKKRY